MDKEAALLVVAKDLFLVGWQEAGSTKYAGISEQDPRKRLERLADEFLAFHNKLKSSVGV